MATALSIAVLTAVAAVTPAAAVVSPKFCNNLIAFGNIRQPGTMSPATRATFIKDFSRGVPELSAAAASAPTGADRTALYGASADLYNALSQLKENHLGKAAIYIDAAAKPLAYIYGHTPVARLCTIQAAVSVAQSSALSTATDATAVASVNFAPVTRSALATAVSETAGVTIVKTRMNKDGALWAELSVEVAKTAYTPSSYNVCIQFGDTVNALPRVVKC